ncbi:MAG: dihydromethanopterin reductase (acceptor) [Euryarchaeota archaeon]|nr:dihydromethanopterin reductase (acceptor) [Euryarchaeota archaeon]
MPFFIAWGITGAAHFLFETFDAMEKCRNNNIKITTLLSRAGKELVKTYGLWSRLKAISPGNYCEEIFESAEQGASFPIIGRFSTGLYKVLIISPTTTNIVAKVVHGISDSLLTNAIAQAMKNSIKVHFVPVEQTKITEISLPIHINHEKCIKCEVCLAVKVCTSEAITIGPRINLLKCNQCRKCIEVCPAQAIIENKKIKIQTRKVDLDNLSKLRNFEGVVVLRHPSEIFESIIKLR